MTRNDFDKLIALEKHRIVAAMLLDRMNGTRVQAIVLANRVDIEDRLLCEFADTMLRRHLEDTIDTITRAMHQLGVEAEEKMDA